MIDSKRPSPLHRSPGGSGTGRQLLYAALLLLGTIGVGTLGYVVLEGWSVGDALYMTIISVTTTGFREVRDLSPIGRVLTTSIIILGLASIAYLGGRVVQLLVESYLRRRKRMERKIARLKNHIIVCGYGRMGRHVCADLAEAKASFVVIERDETQIEALERAGYLYLVGDSSSDEVLHEAGIARAVGIIAVVSTDAENVYTTLTAKFVNPQILVVARALGEDSEPKLRAAGADRVIKPYELVGRRIAQLVLRPSIVEFMDTIARTQGKDISIEEITIDDSSALIGETLLSSPIRKDLNIIIIAVRRADGEFIYNPGSSLQFRAQDRLIAVGEGSKLSALAGLCKAGESK